MSMAVISNHTHYEYTTHFHPSFHPSLMTILARSSLHSSVRSPIPPIHRPLDGIKPVLIIHAILHRRQRILAGDYGDIISLIQFCTPSAIKTYPRAGTRIVGDADT